MRPRDGELAVHLSTGLHNFDREVTTLPGIHDPRYLNCLIEQMLESVHRVRFVKVLGNRKLSALRADPNSELFDPIRASILHKRNANVDEAFWMVFLFVHFGKHATAGFRYAREVYGALGGRRWDWPTVSEAPGAFRSWLRDNQSYIQRDGIPRGFGNHRKYESLDATSTKGTGAVVESYINWVAPPRTHAELVACAVREAGNDARVAFDILYRSMSSVAKFGRTARFDYLCMLANLGLAPIEAPSAYLEGATGPLRGTRLLFGSEQPGSALNGKLRQLDEHLGVGMQVLEDSLCNWQKSPAQLERFRG